MNYFKYINALKKTILISAFFAWPVVFVSSQNVRVGIAGGMNLCGLYGPDSPNQLIKHYGPIAGFYIDSRISEHMSALFEFNFIQYKFNFNEVLYKYPGSLLSVEEKNSYISIPAMLRYKRGYEFIFGFIDAGIQLSGLLAHKRSTTLFLDGLEVDPDYYYGFQNKFFDFGMTAGAGFQYKPFSMELRYYFSTENIYTRDDTREMRYSTINLIAGWQLNYVNKYPFGRKTGWKGFKYKLTHLFK